MIDYKPYGYLFFRAYGSAAAKACLPATFSTIIYVVMYYYSNGPASEEKWKDFNLLIHPYPVTVVIATFTVVLSTRLQFGYGRFWEACTAIQNCHSKWLDVATTLASYHLQSKVYDTCMPASYGDQNFDEWDVVAENEGVGNCHPSYGAIEITGPQQPKHARSFFMRKWRKMNPGRMRHVKSPREVSNICSKDAVGMPFPREQYRRRQTGNKIWMDRLPGDGTEEGEGGKAEFKTTPSRPSLLLQECVHLTSLLSAVALSTLRCCDRDDIESNLTEFDPNEGWPAMDSEQDIASLAKYGYRSNWFARRVKYVFDVSRTDDERDSFNAARPFTVVGGVSPQETAGLQSARGSAAKVNLAFFWLQEFIIRESLHGSFGNVGPPIISRLQQYSSDGHMWFNSARKVSLIPFPFPHAQLASIFVAISSVLIPTLMLSKTEFFMGLGLNFAGIVIIAGVNEVAKELENPFQTIPNDIPLNLFQAQFNEALVTTFSGYHPDFTNLKMKRKDISEDV